MTSTRRPTRNQERGSVVIVVALLGTTLMAFAALAIDIGFLYQSQRGLQAATDAAMMAGLQKLAQDHTSTGQTNAGTLATAFATDNGYTNGVGGTVVTVTPTSNSMFVSIKATQPTFFAGFFGLHSKAVTTSATGQLNPSLPAMYAINNSCAGVGIRIDGGPADILGPVQSNGAMDFATGPNSTTDSPITYGSSCTLTQNNGNNGGAPAPGTVPGDPLGYTLADFPVANCSFGTNFSSGPVNASLLVGFWKGITGISDLNTGIVCSQSDIDFSGTNVTGTVSFIAGGKINASGTGINLTAAPGAHGLVAFSNSNLGDTGTGGCTFPEAVSFGSTDWTLNGSVYAPQGCISIGGTNIQVNGSLIGNDVNVHGGITVNSNSGGGGSYYLFQ